MDTSSAAVPHMTGRKYERDIDLLLAEEFAVSPGFARWFLEQIAFSGEEAELLSVAVSPSDNTGESDLVVVYRNHGTASTFAIHIEDKITAPIQTDQAARYLERGDRAVQRAEYDKFDVVLCAPQFYRDHQSGTEEFPRFVSYEAIADFMEAHEGTPRAAYRAAFLRDAVSKKINTYQRQDDARTNALWAHIYKIASTEFPVLEMKEPHLTKDTTWVTFRPRDWPSMPRLIYVSAKCDRGYMDLTFSNCLVGPFHTAVSTLLEEGMTVHQTGKSVAIRRCVEGFTVAEQVDEALVKARRALAACQALVEFFRRHKEAWLAAAKESLPPLR